MNSSGSKNAQGSFDFSKPPPGYAAPSPANSYASSVSPIHSSAYLPSIIKRESDYTTPEPPAVNDLRFPYHEPHHQLQIARPSSQERSDSAFCSFPSPTPPKTGVAVDPIIFGLTPPPPPADPYPGTGYILSSAVYAFHSPPPGMSVIGAGQYVTQQSGNFHLPQYQGDYGTGYSKRSGFNNHLNRKRIMPQEYDSEGPKKGSAKKKKKPLSQNMPSKKDWSVEDAKRALEVEREFNKRHKSPSLIIKFPDLELNRDIVSKFHSKIESVHFQQPSTPRFCFVTLKDTACMDEVIKDLCQIKFGDGYLTAEPKNNKEEDLVKGPEDIDPLTLYVGNLAQEVTVDDVVKAYPKHKRIDIGFAKKMKYTRYAFVCFRVVDDAIEAFQNTHSTEMYNKSLIVRFRRLHGTVGLPGDPKPQNSQKRNGNESNHSIPAKHNQNLDILSKNESHGVQLIEGTEPVDGETRLDTEPCQEQKLAMDKAPLEDSGDYLDYTFIVGSKKNPMPPNPMPMVTPSPHVKLEPTDSYVETNLPPPVLEPSEECSHVPLVVKDETWIDTHQLKQEILEEPVKGESLEEGYEYDYSCNIGQIAPFDGRT